MQGSLIALLASAIYQIRSADASPGDLDRTYSLIARAAEGEALILELSPAGLTVNGKLLPSEAPGSSLVGDTMALHDTIRLQLPAALEPRHWREIVSLFGAAPGHYSGAAALLAQLRRAIPLAELWGISDPAHRGGWPGQGSPPLVTPGAQAVLTTQSGALGDFSATLAQHFVEGSAAVQNRDAPAIARVLLDLAAMEGADHGQSAIVSKERQRIISPAVLKWLVQELLRPNAPATLSPALATLGEGVVDPLLETFAEATSSREREIVLQLLDRLPRLEALVLQALAEQAPQLLRGAAEVAGRRHMESCIPALTGLLRADDADLRTAAWRALEEIGTLQAIDALRTRTR